MIMDVRIRDFRGIEHADIRLSGLTLIAGSNGAGKTSIAQAVAAVLTGQTVPIKGLRKADAGALVRYGAAGAEVTLDVRYKARPFALLSASEQYRARVILTMAMAVIDNSAVVIFDAADVLDKQGRNDLFRLAIGAGIPVLACMTLLREDADKAASSGKVTVYWLDGGIAERLAPDGTKDAA